MRSRHLPGFRFEVQTPPPADVLPRMDVACFVGFAASGPLQRPVRVESAAQFEMIFGSDTPLAWNEARGEIASAYLAPAVRAFFRNGGRRAWIIRVASDAQIDHFPLTSLLQVTFDDLGAAQIRPAYAPARSAGSWADVLHVCTSLLARTVVLTPIALDPPQFDVTLTSPNDLQIGDLLRVTFKTGSILMCVVNAIEPSTTSPLQPRQYRVTCDKAIWFKSSWQQPPTSANGLTYTFTSRAMSAAITATVPLQPFSPLNLDWPTASQQTAIKLDLDLAYIAAPPIGSLLRVDFDSGTFWLRVEEVSSSDSPGSPPFDGVRVSGQGLWQTTEHAAVTAKIDLAERLSFELWTRAGQDQALRLSDLTFEARHARCWDALPTDLQLYPPINTAPQADYAELWQAAADPRFPLAGETRAATVFVPIAMPLMPDVYLEPEPLGNDALTRDGLSVFNASLFLDPDLTEVGVHDLINEADTLRYQTPQPRRLQGIHAALEIDEATLIIVPDAVQRGWIYRDVNRPLEPPPSDPPLRPDWWHFLACDQKPSGIKAVHEPEWGNFLNCDLRIIAAPVLLPAAADQLGTFTLTWTTTESGLMFEIEESARPDFVGAEVIYRGREQQYTLYGHTPGLFYYRVRGFSQDQFSDYSNGRVVNVLARGRWALDTAYSDTALLSVQHAVLRLCAARGDLFAVLALPEHYRENEALAHLQILTSTGSDFFGPEEARTLSFGAIYHPWLIGREENRPTELRRTPPDGAQAGVYARRTLARGAWLAPAHEYLKGVVALVPPIDRGRWQELQDAQLNLIRHEPQGFTAMNSDTLVDDEDLRPINVRRLLMLLRRLALRLGATYVFEPNDAVFRRSVQRGFEALLDVMFMRGAFAGATAAASYQVVTDSTLNTPQAIDQGRFIVELRVAPSRPLTFMTIRLVQTGDRALVTQEQ